LIESSNWEERVAAAREQRKKVLAQKEQDKADASSGEESSATVLTTLPKPDAQKPEAQELEKADAPAEGALLVVPAAVSEAPATEVAEKRGLHGGALLLAACCAALGLGVALGAGFVMSTQPDRSSQASEIAETSTSTGPVEPLSSANEATEAAEPAEAEIALATVSTSFDSIEQAPTSADISAEPSVAKRISDVRLILPQPVPNLDDVPGTPYGVTLVNYRSDVQPLLPPLPASNTLADISQTAPPEASFELGIGVWDQAADPLRVSFKSAETPPSEALSLLNYQSLMAAPAIDASATIENLDAAPQIDVARAVLDAFVVPPAVTLTTPTAPNAALSALSTDLTWASSNSTVALKTPGLTLPETPTFALLPPEVDMWNGVPIRPTVRPTLASTLGYVGEQAEGVNLVLHAPSGIEQDALDAQTLRVQGTGFVLTRTVRPQFKISKSHLRFYNESDRDLANAIATEMGFALRDFSSANGRAGLIEVWLEGGPDATKQRTTARAAKPKRQRITPRSQSRQRRTNPLDQLRNNLANRLRNGDHL
jgi:hypothetical protein